MGGHPRPRGGTAIPWSTIEPRLLRYDEAGRFGTYVERLFAAVGRERCEVMVFDDLVADPEGQYRRLLDFARLRFVPPPAIKAERASKSVRLLFLQQMLNRPPRILLPYLASIVHHGRFDKAAAKKAQKSAPGQSKSLRRRLLRWNKVPDEKQPLPSSGTT